MWIDFSAKTLCHISGLRFCVMSDEIQRHTLSREKKRKSYSSIIIFLKVRSPADAVVIRLSGFYGCVLTLKA